MAGPGLAFERACTHVARSFADAPAWAGAVLLLVAPLAARDLFQDHLSAPGASVGLSAGLAALGGAILARRMAAPGGEGSVSFPELGTAGGTRALHARRRSLAACVAALLCLPAILTGHAHGRTDRITLGAPAVAGALCGVFPVAPLVVAVAACGGYFSARNTDDFDGSVGRLVVSTGGSRWVVHDTSWGSGEVARVVAVAALLAVVVRGRVLAILCGVLAITGIGTIVARRSDVSWSQFVRSHGHAFVVPVDVLACAALAAVAGALARPSPPGDGTPLVSFRRHPWISVACVLAGASLTVFGLVNGPGGSRREDHVVAGVLLASVALAAGLGGARPGDVLARVPAVLGFQPLVAGLLLATDPWPFGRREDSPLAAAVVALCGGCIAAFVPFRPPTGVIPVACGLLAHFWVALAVAVQGLVPDALVLGALGLPFAVILTSWDARVATLGTAVIWAVAGWLAPRTGPFEFAVAGLAFGVACHLVNRLRAITPVPSDHPVFTEGPHVNAARARGAAEASAAG